METMRRHLVMLCPLTKLAHDGILSTDAHFLFFVGLQLRLQR